MLKAVMKLKRKHLSVPSERACGILLGTLRLCCAMLFSSWLLLVHTGGITPDTYALCRLSGELQTSSLAILILGNIAALSEEFLTRQR